jgi:hypothetical protein
MDDQLDPIDSPCSPAEISSTGSTARLNTASAAGGRGGIGCSHGSGECFGAFFDREASRKPARNGRTECPTPRPIRSSPDTKPMLRAAIRHLRLPSASLVLYRRVLTTRSDRNTLRGTNRKSKLLSASLGRMSCRQQGRTRGHRWASSLSASFWLARCSSRLH